MKVISTTSFYLVVVCSCSLKSRMIFKPFIAIVINIVLDVIRSQHTVPCCLAFAFVYLIGSSPQSQTPSPKRIHSYKSSSNIESFSESDEDEERGEVQLLITFIIN